MAELPLITTIAAAFFSAWVLGLMTHRLGLSPIVGYLLAGILIGPHTPGFVGDVKLAHQLAEVGVMLLMFGVGLHFHVKHLAAVKWIAIPGAVGQSFVATILGAVVFSALGFSIGTGLVMGMAIAVASTVVLIRVLQDSGKLESPAGHAAVGWLIVEDIFTVIALVILPVLGAQFGEGVASSVEQASGFWSALLTALAKLAALVSIVLFAGSRLIPTVLVWVARLRSRELFTLTVLVFSITIAAAAYAFFGASMALGAFLAGMVVGQSPVSQQAASDALPLRDAFAVLFFVSVGMLFEPSVVVEEPLVLLAALGITLIAKPLAALLIVALLGHSVHTGLVISLALAQIGEFSFILSELARRVGLMPEAGHSVLVATAIISISISPFLIRLVGPLESAIQRYPRLWKLLNGRAERRMQRENGATAALVKHAAEGPLRKTAIVVGYGFVGRSVCRLLKKGGMRTVVIDLNMDTVAEINALEDETLVAIFGDAKSPAILEQAGVENATHLLITVAKSSSPAPIIVNARELNPRLRIFVRDRYVGDLDLLVQAGASEIAFEEAEIAIAMGRMVLRQFGWSEDAFAEELNLIRSDVDPLPGGSGPESLATDESADAKSPSSR
jgi:CPA2 family monovalent cation:H+ antiporter-2